MTTNSEQHPNTTTEKSGFQKFMRSHTARFIIVGFISLVLLIPLSLISELIQERQFRQEEVSEDLATEWGGELNFYGLALKVPVIETTTERIISTSQLGESSKVQTREIIHSGYLFPSSTVDDFKTEVDKKYRGIFESNVFNATVNTNAHFNFNQLKVPSNHRIDWSKAKLILITNKDARFKSISAIQLDGKEIAIEQQNSSSDNAELLFSSSIDFPIDTNKKSTLDAALTCAFNGSQEIHYQSLAAKSNMTMKSNWDDPAFSGTSLPNNNTLSITKKGFTGEWSNLEIGNSNRLVGVDKIDNSSQKFSNIRFISMVDHYQLNERTVKYGLLVLVLTFAVFFLIQVVGKISIHPLHYFMIGLALLLFYSLLLSFSEQIGFVSAYIIASITIIGLIVWYAKSILHSIKFAVMSGISLGLLYAFLMVIVHLEIYALIVGSIGLLFVLVAIMSITRKINFDTV